MDTAPNTKSHILRNTLIALFVISAILAFAYVNKEAVHQTLDNLKLIPRPERFTELYFNETSALPKETVAGKPMNFSFTVHNREGVTMNYPYIVYFEYPDGEQVIFEKGSLTLEHDQYMAVPIDHTFISSNIRGKVFVMLTSLNQYVNFLLPDLDN